MRPVSELARRLLFWLALPWVLPQAYWVRHRANRLPEASGPTHGHTGRGEPLRFLAIGDSVIAGVGCQRTEDAMTAQVARLLAEGTSRRVDWTAVGRNGARVSHLRSELFPMLPTSPRFDAILVCVGVNDVTGLTTSRAWRARMLGLVRDLQKHSPEAAVAVFGTPPLDRFPLLPWPLRELLGMRARILDRVTRRALDGMTAVRHVPVRFDALEGNFAVDGYHPAKGACPGLAALVVGRLREIWVSGEASYTPSREEESA